MKANDRQVGGDHYKDKLRCPSCQATIDHWDVAWIMDWDCFQYIITKWIWRWRQKGGLQDLHKVRHAIDKYIELVEAAEKTAGAEPGPGYVNQDFRGQVR